MHLAAEEGVIVVEARFAVGIVTLIENDRLVELGPRMVRAQLGARRVIRSHQYPFEVRGHGGVGITDRVMQSGDEQHERRDALLSVDEDQVDLRGVLCGEDGADEMAVRVAFLGDGADVGEQALASADVPAVLALVDRDDDGRVRSREPLDRVDGGRFDIRGGCHVLRSCSSRRCDPATRRERV